MGLRVLPDSSVGQEGVPLKVAAWTRARCLRKNAEHQLQQVKAERRELQERFFFNTLIFLSRD